VHGDLKPENVLISDHNSNAVCVADFGLVEIRDERDVASTSTLDMSLHTKGTRRYCAAEMLPNPRSPNAVKVAKASRKTDMYAFAVLAWEIFAQEKPYAYVGNDDVRLCIEVHSNVRPPVDDIRKQGIPPQVIGLIESCWDSDRAKRPTAAQCLANLSIAHTSLLSKEFDIFFSHPWRYKPLLSNVYAALVELGYRVWYDENEMGYDLVVSMKNGIEKSQV
jgi:serine/threonine protein kinase